MSQIASRGVGAWRPLFSKTDLPLERGANFLEVRFCVISRRIARLCAQNAIYASVVLILKNANELIFIHFYEKHGFYRSRLASDAQIASVTHRRWTLTRKTHAFQRPPGRPSGPFPTRCRTRGASRCCAVNFGSLAICASEALFSSNMPLVLFSDS